MKPKAPVPHLGPLRWYRYDDWFAALLRFTRRYGIGGDR